MFVQAKGMVKVWTKGGQPVLICLGCPMPPGKQSLVLGRLGWFVNLGGSGGREWGEGRGLRTQGSEEEEASEGAPQILAEVTG